MNRVILLAIILQLVCVSHAFTATIRGWVTADDFPDGAPGVNVVVYRDSIATGQGAATDSSGRFAITSLPAGAYQIHFSSLGYVTEIQQVLLQEDSEVFLQVKLSPQPLTLSEFTVTASIARHEVALTNTPLRVEVMVPEELQDKIAFSPNMAGALRYSGGVLVNPSHNLYEAENVRLRGLDSRYLLLLGDQTPVLGYQPEEVGIWTLPLVGVKQLEISKGDLSALYGFGNSGAVNAVLRTPFSDTLNLFALARSNFEADHYAGLYTGKRWEKVGLSGILSGEQFAVNDSLIRRYVIQPRFDYQTGATKANLSAAVLGSLAGQDQVLFGRQGASAAIEFPLMVNSRLLLQGQFANQTRGYTPDPGRVKANSQIGYGAAQFIHEASPLTSIAGLDAYGEDWELAGQNPGSNCRLAWMAAFLQEEWAPHEHWSFLYDGRVTRINLRAFGSYAYSDLSGLPLISNTQNAAWGLNQFLSLLWKPGYFLSFRLLASYGTVLPQTHYLHGDTDSLQIMVPSNDLRLERCWNGSFDVKLSKILGSNVWTGDLSFFVTDLIDRVDAYSAANSAGGLQTRLENRSGYLLPGLEIFSRLDLGEEAALLLGYMYLAPSREFEQNPGTLLPLPRHQGNFELDWEIEPTGLRVEIEGKVLSQQKTPGNAFRTEAPPYAVWGATLEYTLGRVKVFAGAENIFDFRQSDPGPLWGPRVGRELYLGMKGMW